MLWDAQDAAWCFMLIEFCNNVIECSVMPMMLYDVVLMNMIYHVVSIVSTMSKYAIGCTWCSMMNHDVGNVFIAYTSFQRICRTIWRFIPINAMWCSYCSYVCDDHIQKVPFFTSTYIWFFEKIIYSYFVGPLKTFFDPKNLIWP